MLLSGKDLVTVFELMIADRRGVVGHRDHGLRGQFSVGEFVPEHGLAAVGRWRVLSVIG